MKSQFKFKSNFKLSFLFLFVIILFIIFLSLVLLNEKVSNSNQISQITSNISEDVNKVDTKVNEEEWSITIPNISLYEAPIQNGIDMNILNNYVGHFPSTCKENGNIGLAAHNRGYNKNYFANIDKLNIGDEIIYKNNQFVKTYKVNNKIEIDSYDWTYLNSTDSDVITLITCVTDKPDKRLVVQGNA